LKATQLLFVRLTTPQRQMRFLQKGRLKIVASGSSSVREAQPYDCTVSIAGPRLTNFLAQQ